MFHTRLDTFYRFIGKLAPLAWLFLWAWPLADVCADAESRYHNDVQPILTEYCYGCHGDGGAEGGMQLDRFDKFSELVSDKQQWEAVWKNLRSQVMPPPDEPRPNPTEQQTVISWIEAEVFGLDPEHPDPGRVTLRRLNRQEYHYTIQDLLGIDFDTNEAFPPDDTGYGFDTVGDALTLSPLLMEKYLAAAREIADQIVARPAAGSKAAAEEEGESETESESEKVSLAYDRVFLDGPPTAKVADHHAYTSRILQNFANRAFRRPVEDATLDRLIALAEHSDDDRGDDPANGARSSITKFEDGIALALTAILSSPRFLYRTELQPRPDDPSYVVPLDEFALASRLSYFLWSSLPDEEMWQLAEAGDLRSNLTGQVERMLDDDKSQRFISNFVGQWLRTRDVEGTFVDSDRILRRSGRDGNVFDWRVRQAMRQETEMFFAHLVAENRPPTELLAANYTFLNEPLAKFYGVEGVEGREMRKVDLPPKSRRGGLLTHGSVLLVTSNPTRTSPVKRGLFILENLLGVPTPPAPPNVPALDVPRDRSSRRKTMREMMEAHRAEPLCASCHARMDPLGLALEKYDAVGSWRGLDRGKPIQTAGRLLTGEEFTDVFSLQEILVEQRSQDVVRCVTEKLMTYALGRGLEYYDMPVVTKIVDNLTNSGGGTRTLIHQIVVSAPFQSRRGDDPNRAPDEHQP